MKRFALFVSPMIFAAASLANAQDGPVPKVTSSIVTSGSSLAIGQRIPVQSFKQEDYVISIVTMQWSPATASAGRHFIEHKWMLNGTIVSDNKHMRSFDTTPVTLSSRRAAAALGAGHFDVQTLVDGNVVGDSEFDITN